MAILKSLVWILVLALGGVLLYRFLRGHQHTVEEFQSVAGLTPVDLEAFCGEPVQDTSGVVVENDGIRDLSYRDADGAALVFRFIAEDDVHWRSLGAWEEVNAPNDLGDPVSAVDAARRLPCAVTSSARTSRLDNKRGGTAAFLATMIQDMPLTLSHTPPAPVSVPMPTLSTPGPATSPALTPPQPYVSPSLNAEQDTPVSAESGSDGLQPRTLPCPPETGPCELLGYAQFVAQLHQAIRDEHENQFARAMTLLTEHGAIVVQLPSLEASRTEAVKAIVQLEVKVINIVETRLCEDVVHLAPFQSDSSEMKSKKMALVEHDDQENRRMWKEAVEQNRPAAGLSRSVSGSTYRFNSEAYQQLVQIHLTGNWPP